MRLSQQNMDEEEEEEEAKADWRFMAMALDRACLFFYTILTAIIPLWIFMSIPTSLKASSNGEYEANSTTITLLNDEPEKFM